jgi:hypothetical protein
MKRLRVSRERNFSAHHMLLRVAAAALEDAEKKLPGWFSAQFTAMTMCALSLEAICNAVGERVVTDWKDFESANPTAKLRLICQQTGIEYNRNKEPWATACWLSRFRNAIAHAKPEFVKQDVVWTEQEYERRRRESPESTLESEITLGNARRAVHGMDKIKDLLCQKIPVEHRLGLYSDAWTGSATMANDD